MSRVPPFLDKTLEDRGTGGKWPVLRESMSAAAKLIWMVVLMMSVAVPAYPNSTDERERKDDVAPQAASTKQPEVNELKLGQAIERQMAGGEVHVYRVTLTTGQYLKAVVEQKGIDVVVRLFGPDSKKMTEVDGPYGPQGMEMVYAIADISGEHHLEVSSLDGKAAAGRYEITLEELRESKAQDRHRIAAGRSFAEGEQFRSEGPAESQRKAIVKYNDALSLWRLGEDRKEEARTLNRIGSVYWTLGEYQKAIEYYNQTLPIWHEIGDRREEARTLHNFGVVYWQLGDSRKALGYYNQALPLWRDVIDRSGEAATFGAIGLAYDNLGMLHEAIDAQNQSLSIQLAIGERRNEANTLISIGNAYAGLGDLQKALDYLSRALMLKRAAGDRRGEGAALSNIGVIYWQLGENDKAIEYYNQALPLRRETGDRSGEFSTLHNIGRASGDPQKAFEYYSQALSLARTLGDRRGEGAAVQSIGAAYRLLGQPQKALASLNQALTLHRDVGDRRQEATALAQIGASYSSLGKPEEGLGYLEQALALHRAIGDRGNEAATLQSIARVEQDQGNFNKARAHIESALNIIESTRSQFISQQLRTSFLASRQGYYEFYIALLMRMHRDQPSGRFDAAALQGSERARARTLLEILIESRAEIREGVDAVLLQLERSLQQQLSVKSERLTRLLGGKHTEEQEAVARKEVEALLADYQGIEAKIRTKSPRYAALTQPQPLSLKEIQQQVLDDDTLLLEYSLGEERSYLWAVTPNSIKSFDLPKRAEIEASARRVYDLLVAKADALYPEALTTLSQMLLKPVADQLGHKRLLVVSEGALQYIPLGALPVPSSNAGVRGQSLGKTNSTALRSLIEDHEIVSLPSASVLAILRRELGARKPAPRTVAVLADPVFDKDDQRVKSRFKSQNVDRQSQIEKASDKPALHSDVERSIRESGLDRFDRLGLSRREADLITALAFRGQPLKALDFAASRATAISSELGQYQIVHFATHSLLNNQHPELSGIVLSLVDEQGQPQDGFLRLYEIYNLKLSADLVVLSACQTALGKEIKGEGLVGLTRGFMYAGAPRVVASLWKVSDKATAELMKRFYGKLLRDGLRPAAALRAAQVSMLKEEQWSAAYYWAGFVLQGEWR